MEYRELGETGIKVSELALGSWQFSGDRDWGTQEEDTSIATVHAALDAGVSLFDTAEMYGDGRSDLILGKALRGRRDRAVIAAKVSRSPMSREAVRSACELSLHRLQTDYIDLYQVHYWDRHTPIEECLSVMVELKKAGMIRAIGTCNSGCRDIADMMRHAAPATNQMPYSLLWRAIEFAIQPLCVDKKISLLCYSPLAQGLLTGKYRSADEVPVGRARTRLFSKSRLHTRHGEAGAEETVFAVLGRLRSLCDEAHVPLAQASLAWVRSRPGVAAAIVGARTPAQIQENVAFTTAAVSSALIEQLSLVTEHLKVELGANPDPWQADSRAR
jgi:aryl-alcohol dehydrogenase-like predicted oxidoreductase